MTDITPASDPIAPADAPMSDDQLNNLVDAELGISPAPVEEPEPPKEDVPQPPKEPAIEEEPAPPPKEPEPEPKPEPAAAPIDLKLTVKDAKGTEYQIESIEDLPEDFEPANNRQILQIIRDLNNLDQQKAEAEKNAATKEKDDLTKANQAAYEAAWDAEIQELMDGGRLDKPAAKPGDKTFLQDPAIQRVDAVFKYMQKVNEARAKAGSKTFVTSFEDALDKLELVEAREAKAKADATAADEAKRQGSLVGGGSSGSSGAAGASYVSGQYRNIWEVPVD